MYITWKLERTPFINNAFAVASTTTLTDFRDVKVDSTLGDSKNSFDFKVPNFTGKYNNYFNMGDKITLSRVLNSGTTSTTDVVMVGCVNDLPSEINTGTDYISVRGYDFSESILGGILFADFNNTNKTIPEALSFGLDTIRNYNPQFTVTWHPDNRTTKTDGTAFPYVNEKFYYKKYSLFLEKYSSSKYTTDAYSYFSYVDTQNRLVWNPRLSTPIGSFNASLDNFKAMKFTKDTKDVINFLIVQGGLDPRGRPLQVPVIDQSSVSKNGMKFYYLVDDTNKSKSLNSEDMAQIGGTSSSGTLPSKILGSTYSFTPRWSSVPCTSDDDYVTKFQTYMKAELKKIGQSYIENLKNGKLKVDIEFAPGTKTWVLGDVISCVIPQISSSTKNLRIKEISYSSSADIYSLEEDKGSL